MFRPTPYIEAVKFRIIHMNIVLQTLLSALTVRASFLFPDPLCTRYSEDVFFGGTNTSPKLVR